MRVRAGILLLVIVGLSLVLGGLLFRSRPTAGAPATRGVSAVCAIRDRGRVSLAPTDARPAWTVTLEPDEEPEPWGFAADFHRLVIRRPEGAPIVHRFVSTYGKATLHLRDLTGDGREELVLRTGMGRGTDVRSERIEVFGVGDGRLESLLTAPVSGWFSGAREFGIGHWEYRLTFEDLDGDGIDEIDLLLEHDPVARGRVARGLPEISRFRHAWNRRRRRFESTAR